MTPESAISPVTRTARSRQVSARAWTSCVPCSAPRHCGCSHQRAWRMMSSPPLWMLCRFELPRAGRSIAEAADALGGQGSRLRSQGRWPLRWSGSCSPSAANARGLNGWRWSFSVPHSRLEHTGTATLTRTPSGWEIHLNRVRPATDRRRWLLRRLAARHSQRPGRNWNVQRRPQCDTVGGRFTKDVHDPDSHCSAQRRGYR